MKDKEIFTVLLKSAKVKNYAEDKMTLSFTSVPRAKHFEKLYRKKFEDSASNLFGRQITVEVEGV